eukprot:TRINITY_DN1981_c0_g1_i1.p1 TRINITY_DN1981_c0_g1~~TRINITY_DN1981_c0_g1_i1.p1  ORF type:complete len:190 (+),score=17.89 TRINITY_DN1981_c0_g1_i1:30-572(+)
MTKPPPLQPLGHGDVPPVEKAKGECLVCFDDIADGNLVAYRTHAGSEWYQAYCCVGCFQNVFKRNGSFAHFRKLVDEADCFRQVRNLVESRIWYHFKDDMMMPVPLNDHTTPTEVARRRAEVHEVWRGDTKQASTPVIDGALDASERASLYSHLLEMHDVLKDMKDEDVKAELGRIKGGA